MMKFLADIGISPKTVSFLRDLVHQAVHPHQEGLRTLSDAEILEKARCEGSIVLTHDLDFGDLLAASGARLPTVIIFRLRNMRPERVNLYLQNIITQHATTLDHGVIATVAEGVSAFGAFPWGLPSSVRNIPSGIEGWQATLGPQLLTMQSNGRRVQRCPCHERLGPPPVIAGVSLV